MFAAGRISEIIKFKNYSTAKCKKSQFIGLMAKRFFAPAFLTYHAGPGRSVKDCYQCKPARICGCKPLVP